MTGNPDNDALMLAEGLAAKLCHDLAGPLGTIAAALDPADQGDAEGLTLARDATTELVQRLRLYRAAWAEGAGPGSVAELAGLAEGLAHRRVRLDVAGLPGASRLRGEFGRVVLNAVLLAAEGMPRGGTVAVHGNPAVEIAVMLTGPGAGWPEGAAEALANPAMALVQRHERTRMLAHLLALLAAREGLRLGLLMGPGGVHAPPLLITRV